MVTRRPRSYLKTLSSLSRINLLNELYAHGSMTIDELATATGLHHNTAREHLHRLIDAGFVCSEPIPRTGKGRPRILYRAANRPGDSARRARHHAAEVRTEHFHRLARPRESSTDNLPLNKQLDMLDDHMNQCGFEAEINTDATRMVMHECPFAALAKDHPQVCQVHFALLTDALELESGPLAARELHPFSGPNDCTVDFDNDTELSGKSRE